MNAYIRRLTTLAAFAAFAAITIATAACGDDSRPARARTVDVDQLTFEDVQQRALEAVRREGQVYHVAVRSTRSPDDASDAWLYLQEDVARSQRRGVDDDDVRIVYGQRVAMVVRERFYDAPCEPCSPHIVAMTAPHLGELFADDPRDIEIEEGVVDGEPTIRIRLTREYGGDYTGDVDVTIDLDESFLPVQMRQDPPGPLPGQTLAFENEFAPRDTLAAGFFSPEALRALAGGPAADIDAALADGLDVYWLGETFEDMILRDESRYYMPDDSTDAQGRLVLSYGPTDLSQPAPCVSIEVARAGAPALIDRDAMQPFDTIAVGDATAELYRIPRPSNFPPQGDPGPITPVPDDTGDQYAAVIETGASVIEVMTNCGPIGSNLYRTEEAFRRLSQSLRPYDGDPE